MKLFKTILLLISIVLIGGCNQMRPQQNYSANNVRPESWVDVMHRGNEAAANCTLRVREAPSGQAVSTSILIFSDSQSNRSDLLASKNRLNQAQKNSLKQFLAESNSCRNLRLEANKNTTNLPLIQKDYAEKDAVYQKLLANQITIGDANKSIQKINAQNTGAMKSQVNQVVAPSVQQAPSPRPINVIGQTFDSQANGNIYLYDGPCKLPNYSGNYPLRWDAKRADNGALIGEGCYTVNQQQVTMIATTGLTVSRPMSLFQGGGNKSVFQSFAEGLQRATTYWNNSAAETQRNTTNLTPGMTGGNGMNCTPDGRGGYNCR